MYPGENSQTASFRRTPHRPHHWTRFSDRRFRNVASPCSRVVDPATILPHRWRSKVTTNSTPDCCIVTISTAAGVHSRTQASDSGNPRRLRFARPIHRTIRTPGALCSAMIHRRRVGERSQPDRTTAPQKCDGGVAVTGRRRGVSITQHSACRGCDLGHNLVTFACADDHIQFFCSGSTISTFEIADGDCALRIRLSTSPPRRHQRTTQPPRAAAERRAT